MLEIMTSVGGISPAENCSKFHILKILRQVFISCCSRRKSKFG